MEWNGMAQRFRETCCVCACVRVFVDDWRWHEKLCGKKGRKFSLTHSHKGSAYTYISSFFVLWHDQHSAVQSTVAVTIQRHPNGESVYHLMDVLRIIYTKHLFFQRSFSYTLAFLLRVALFKLIVAYISREEVLWVYCFFYFCLRVRHGWTIGSKTLAKGDDESILHGFWKFMPEKRESQTAHFQSFSASHICLSRGRRAFSGKVKATINVLQMEIFAEILVYSLCVFISAESFT